MFSQLLNPFKKVKYLYFVLIILLELFTPIMNSDNNSYIFKSKHILNPTQLELHMENINGTSVRLSMTYQMNTNHTLKSMEYLKLRITYYLMLKKTLYLLAHNVERPCDTQTESLSKLVAPNLVADSLDVEVCKGNVFMFGGYNDTVNKDYSHLFNYCTNRTTYANIEYTSSTIINDLLPNRPYLFRFAVVTIASTGDEHVIEGDSTDGSSSFSDHTICTNNSIPLHPPQTDPGSFRVISPPTDPEIQHDKWANATRRVELFWRPVPTLMIGSGQITYELNCMESRTNTSHYNESIPGITSGKIDIDKSFQKDEAYTCELRSKNALGYSKKSSIINIPKQDRLIKTYGKFNIFSIAFSNNHYQVRWPNMTTLLSDPLINKDLSDTIRPGRGVYTLYWCTAITTSTTGCDTIVGMRKTTDVTYFLKIPGQITYANFGVSYRNVGNTLYTGIIWTPCVANIHHSLEPLRIIHYLVSENHIDLEWNVHPCMSAISLFQNYTIEYCLLRSVDFCSSQPNSNLEKDDAYFGDKEKCKSVTIPNDLIFTKARLSDLDDSTKYQIRIRANLNATSHNKWSDPIYITTTVESRSCVWQQYRSLVFSAVALTFLLGLLILRKNKIIAFYEEVQLLLEARASIPRRIEEVLNNEDNISEIEMKYWVDHTPENASVNEFPFYSESDKGSMIENNCCNGIDKEDKSMSVPDYIDPIYLMNGQARALSQESLSDNSENSRKASEMDTDNDSEISIASHSSFINNLLRDD